MKNFNPFHLVGGIRAGIARESDKQSTQSCTGNRTHTTDDYHDQ